MAGELILGRASGYESAVFFLTARERVQPNSPLGFGATTAPQYKRWLNPNSVFVSESLRVKMRCSILAIVVLATVAWEAPVVQSAPPQQSGPVNHDLLRSATTCSSRRPLTSDNGLPFSLLSSRSVAGVRWVAAEAPEIALRIIGANAVSDVRLARFITGLAGAMQMQPDELQAQHLPSGFRAYEAGAVVGSRFMFSICPQPRGNPALTYEVAHRVLYSLYFYMAREGGFRLLQYHAFTAGATPAQEVHFASGAIAWATVAIPDVPLQARSLPVLAGSGRR